MDVITIGSGSDYTLVSDDSWSTVTPVKVCSCSNRPGIPNETRFGSAWPEKFHSVYVMNGNYLLTNPFINRISNTFCRDMVNLIMYLHVFQDRLVKNTK